MHNTEKKVCRDRALERGYMARETPSPRLTWYVETLLENDQGTIDIDLQHNNVVLWAGRRRSSSSKW